MEIKISTFVIVLLYTVYCSLADSSDFAEEGDYEEYEEQEEREENKLNAEKKPLKISTTGKEFIKNLSDTVILPCEITGGNFVQVWRRKNVIEQDSEKNAVLFQAGIRMAASLNIDQLANGSLQISNLHVQDAGDYECLAMGDPKNTPSIHHRITLKVPPQIEYLLAKDNRTILRNGETLSLTCKASGYPKPEISWHKGSSRIDIKGENLEISDITHQDAATYKCLADNKIGEPAFNFINIEVEHKPVISIERISVHSENTRKTELECLVHAVPRAQVVWKKDGTTIQNNEHTRLITNKHSHNLALKDLRDSDFGAYTCSATNYLGMVEKTLSLVKTPGIRRFEKKTFENNVSLTWEVESWTNITANELSYRQKGSDDWIRVDPEMNKAKNEMYEIKYVFRKNPQPVEYEINLRTQNLYGWSEYAISIFVDKASDKHGQHKSHKKGHKHGKESQNTSTPTLSSQTEPAKHQEKLNQSDMSNESFVRAANTSHSSSVTPAVLPIIISIVTMTVLQIVSGSVRT